MLRKTGLTIVSSNDAKLDKSEATSGWSGPRTFEWIASEHLYSGSALAF